MKVNELRNLTQGLYKVASPRDQARLYARIQSEGMEMANLYQELEMNSCYVDTHKDVSFEGAAIHMHTHSFYEFLCVQSVCGVEYTIDTQCVPLQKGDILVLPPDVRHCPLFPETMPTPYVRDVLWISREFAQIMFSQMPQTHEIAWKGGVLRTAGTPWESLTELFRKGVRETEERKTNWELAVMGNTLTLMAQLHRFLGDQTPASREPAPPQPLERALSYIEQHYFERISLEDAARHCYISESTLCHTFREKMGVSFYRCLTQRRLIEAKGLILSGMAMEDVGKAVGFSDYAAFYRAFKREYGVSPGQFKKLRKEASGQ